MKSADFISVPIIELQRLEKSRVGLYKFLEGELGKQGLIGLTGITSQILRVANKKSWKK